MRDRRRLPQDLPSCLCSAHVLGVHFSIAGILTPDLGTERRLAPDAFLHLLLPFPAEEPRETWNTPLWCAGLYEQEATLLSSQEPSTKALSETARTGPPHQDLQVLPVWSLSCQDPGPPSPEALRAGYGSASLTEVLRLTGLPLAAQAPVRQGQVPCRAETVQGPGAGRGPLLLGRMVPPVPSWHLGLLPPSSSHTVPS